MRMIAGLEEISGGSISIDGRTLGDGEYAAQMAHDGAIDAVALARSLEKALARPFPQLSPALVARPRVATAHFPADGTTFDALMHHADQQLADRPISRARR